MENKKTIKQIIKKISSIDELNNLIQDEPVDVAQKMKNTFKNRSSYENSKKKK